MKKEKKTDRNKKKYILEAISSKNYRPMVIKELAALLNVPKSKREELQKVLNELQREGKIVKIHKDRYKKNVGKKNDIEKKSDIEKKKSKDLTKDDLSEKEIVHGTFIGNAKGFGFVEVEDSDSDIFIPEVYTNTAIHKDEVEVLIQDTSDGKRREGRILSVLTRNTTEIIGTLQLNGTFGFVVSDNNKIPVDVFIPKEHLHGAKDNDKVICTILDYGKKRKNPTGKITEVLGAIGAKGVDVLAIAKGYDLPMEFPDKVMNQVQRCPQEVLRGDFDGRMDLRDSMMVTIDGEDAKDLDDAVSLEMDGELYKLGVHIADVSNYVQEKSALDREAIKRGTSVYLVDRVIPMLPKELSNGICSLNENQNRLALSCFMWINKNGTIKEKQITESVIKVDKRMSYTDVNKVISGNDNVPDGYQPYVSFLLAMQQLAVILRKKRKKRGNIDFDFPECKIILDDNGKPIDIKPYPANEATHLIEEFMLAANETVAKTYSKRKVPFLYRIHEIPDAEKMEATLTFIRNQGFNVKKEKNEITPKEVQTIMKKIIDTPQEAMISRMMLRSMKQARYDNANSGHFGLAAKYYCHFTSPIRRYPDLQIHRIIKDDLRKRLNAKRKEHYASILPDIATETSAKERRADETERETDKMKKAEYMSYHIGETFKGVVSGVTGWGLYVELPNTVEGLVHMNVLRDDYYVFDEENYRLVGEATKKTYTIGQPVEIKVIDSDSIRRTVDFELKMS